MTLWLYIFEISNHTPLLTKFPMTITFIDEIEFWSTGWSIWYCPILNVDCGIFSEISKQVFWVILITNFDTFCYLKSDFWYSKKIFWAQNHDNSKGPPYEKKISSSLIWKILPDNKMYQNFHYKSYFQTYLTPRIDPQ